MVFRTRVDRHQFCGLDSALLPLLPLNHVVAGFRQDKFHGFLTLGFIIDDSEHSTLTVKFLLCQFDLRSS